MKKVNAQRAIDEVMRSKINKKEEMLKWYTSEIEKATTQGNNQKVTQLTENASNEKVKMALLEDVWNELTDALYRIK